MFLFVKIFSSEISLGRADMMKVFTSTIAFFLINNVIQGSQVVSYMDTRHIHGGRFLKRYRGAGEILRTPWQPPLHFFEDIAKLDEFARNLSAHKCVTDRLSGSHGFIIIDLCLDSISGDF